MLTPGGRAELRRLVISLKSTPASIIARQIGSAATA
jgi:hypothetical protein